jgi:sugar phosphate isomerase/epimerase
MTGLSGRVAVVASALHEDLRLAVKIAQEAGFAGVQLDPRMGAIDLLGLSQSGRRELLGLLRSHQLEPVGLRVDLGAKGISAGADIDAVLDRIEKILALAPGLACPLICVDLGPPPADAALLELARRADRHGVIVAFRGELLSMTDLEKAAKTGDCPWFGIDLDPVAVLRDELTGDEIFSRLGQLVRHVRARDAVIGTDHRTKTVIVGKGAVDWPALLANLEGAAFNGWITVDPSELQMRRAAASAAIQFLDPSPDSGS